ncbi:hypothetical protein VHUM_04052 [Vanrija humicola]|uniref:Major facilitator superfamily (MFS) profile domain-containing protein n=1 Tax=Vanrija humicola TaxID=5417 RepID=A0A7D8YZR5_VANHU|nr:hypothetical protein VHUM_04052 [Vanrija humicola]
MPMLMLLYGIQYSDKTSLSAGVIFGLRDDTHMTLAQYSTLTAFFYMAYALAQYPMMFFLQRVPLGRGLGVCIVVWGAMVMLLAACNNYAQLAAVRTFLGWFEAVVTPGFALFTSSWYLRREQTHRQNLYYSMNTFFAIVFGLGIYYIAKNAQERGGLAAWRVINLFLGSVTVGLGIIFLVFGGTPDEVWWLTAREKRMAKARIVSNGTGTGGQQGWDWAQVKECLYDQQFWLAVVYNITSNIPNGSITTFNTLVIQSFGFTNLQTIMYNLPGYAVACTSIVACGFAVHYWPKTRFPLAITMQMFTFVALIYAGTDKHSGKWTKWAIWTVFSHQFAIGCFLTAWPMISLNVAGRTKKSFFGGSSLLAYCVGNIIGSQVMRPSDAPRYFKGLTVSAVFMLFSTVNLGHWWWYLWWQNKKRDEAFAASGMTLEEREHLNRVAGENDVTDLQNKHFRYIY